MPCPPFGWWEFILPSILLLLLRRSHNAGMISNPSQTPAAPQGHPADTSPQNSQRDSLGVGLSVPGLGCPTAWLPIPLTGLIPMERMEKGR